MKKQSAYLAGTYSLLLLFLATGFRPGPKMASATGQGALSFNGGVQHFAFHALKSADGTVRGSWESRSEGADNRTHGMIKCFTILADGKIAILSGVITKKDGTGFPQWGVGNPIWFKVKDNGEGAKSEPDEFSDYYMGLSGCFDYGIPLLPIENGNIQVKK